MKLKKNEILVLRTCKENGESYNGFIWPRSGHVEAPDWSNEPVCGNGLHGLPWGVGLTSDLSWNGDLSNGWVVKIDTSKDYVHGVGEFFHKCKFKSGDVVFVGHREDCVKLIQKHAPVNSRINWSTLTGGDWSTLTGGDRSTLTGGYGSTLTGGDWSTLTGGYESTLTGGYGSTLTGGDESTLTGGDESTFKAGKGSVLICRYYDGEHKTSVLIIDESNQNKTYKCVYGKWSEIK